MRTATTRVRLRPFSTFFFSALLGVLLVVLCPAGAAAQATNTRTLKIAVSIPPQKYFLEKLVGPEADILVVLPPQADHENYEPGIAQLEQLSQVEAYVAVSHPKAQYESVWLSRLEELRQGKADLKILRPSRKISVDPLDVHYWTSPRLVAQLVEALAEDLKVAFPYRSEKIASRTAAFLLEIQALDKELKTLFDGHQSCQFLVYHGAWGYFAKDYGLRQLAFEDAGREPGMLQTAKTLQAAKDAGIHVLFLEPQRPAATVRAFTEELSATPQILDPMSEQWADNLRSVAKRILSSCGSVEGAAAAAAVSGAR